MEEHVYHRMAEIQDRHWWYEARRQILSTLIAKLKLPPQAQILEVGSGPGANIKMLSAFGTLSVLEPDNFSREHIIKTYGLPENRVKDGMLPGNIPFDSNFDLICAFDVIEHIEQDSASLKDLFESLKTGGHAVFSVPAYQFLWSSHDVALHHKRRYTRAAFGNLLKQAGFQVEFISYYNTALFPLIAAVRLAKKFLGIKKGADDTMPRFAIVNTLLRMIFAAEKYLLNPMTFPFGVSIIAVCKKQDAS